MRTNTAERFTVEHGVAESAAFTIKATGKGFQVLIDSLYSDKIAAGVRELISNAFDSHARAGKSDTPFHVQVPNHFEPHFAVRDFGVGMTHETIMTLYSRLFESSKENDNVEVGKFGIGSKSPFAYSDAFTVTAYDGEEKRMYSAYIGKDGVPRIALMGREPSSEPRGIEVAFPVKSTDIHRFSSAVRNMLWGLPVRPMISGTVYNDNDLNGEVVIKGGGWTLYKSINGTSHQAYVRQGCVTYPIDSAHFTGLGEDSFLLESPILIDFPIGHVDVTANREQLSYDDDTKRNIADRLNTIHADIVKDVEAEIEKADTYWAACRLRHEIRARFPDSARFSALDNIKWRGRPLVECFNLFSILKKVDRAPNVDGGRLMVTLINSTDVRRFGRTGKRVAPQWSPAVTGAVYPEDTLVVIEDTTTKVVSASARLRNWFETADISDAVLWVRAPLKSVALKRLLVALGRPKDVHYVHEMDIPKHQPSMRRQRSTVELKRYVLGQLRDVTVDNKDDAIYVRIYRDRVLKYKGDAHVTHTDCVRAYELLTELGYIKDKPLVFVPQSRESAIKRNKHWVSLFDIIKLAIEEKYCPVKAGQAIAYNKLLNGYEIDGPQILMRKNFVALADNPAFTGFKHEGPAQTLYEFWKRVSEKAKDTDLYVRLSRMASMIYGYNDNRPTPYDVALPFSSRRVFLERYPLFKLSDEVFNHCDSGVVEAAVEYVNSIDGHQD